MWLFNFMKRSDDKTIQQDIQDIIVNDELIDESSLIEEEVNRNKKFEELQERIKYVRTLHTKLEVLREEQNINVQNATEVYERENNEEYVSSYDYENENENENEETDQIDNSEIKKIQTTIANLENILQMLSEKVSHLTDTLADIQKDRNEERQKEKEIVSECNIKSDFNSVNASNKNSLTMTNVNQPKLIKNTKNTRITDTTKRKYILTKKNERVITKNEQTTFKANSTKSNISGVPKNETREENDKWKMLDSRLFKLENKMAVNENNIEKLMGKLDTIISYYPVDNMDVRNRCNQEQQVNPEDIEYTYEQTESKVVRKVPSKSLETNNNPVMNKNSDGPHNNNDTDKCTVDQCVCKLIGNDMKSDENKNKNKYGIQILCDYFQSNFGAKQTEYPRSKTEQVDNKSNQLSISNDVKVNKQETIFSNKSSYILNNIKENRSEPTFKSNYGKNGVCDLIHSQSKPDEKINKIPEKCRKTQEQFSYVNRTSSTARQETNINTVQSRRQQIIKPKPELSNSFHKKRKIYSINRVVNDNNQNEIIYQAILDKKRWPSRNE